MKKAKHTAHVTKRKSWDTMVLEWCIEEAEKERIWYAMRTNRPKSLDITTYDNSGSPYGVADVFHGKKNRGRCYNEPSFQLKLNTPLL